MSKEDGSAKLADLGITAQSEALIVPSFVPKLKRVCGDLCAAVRVRGTNDYVGVVRFSNKLFLGHAIIGRN